MRTKRVEIRPTQINYELIAQAAHIIQQGGLVVFPTETVYGIAANFQNPHALQALREVKQRSDNKPFSVLVADKEAVDDLAPSLPLSAYKILDAFWPGPLTAVLPTSEAGKTIGLRMPNHPVALALIQHAGCPVAAPSANLEDEPPARTCAQALSTLEGLVEMAIDSGEADLGQSSTVVDLTTASPKILRPGPISLAQIEEKAKIKTVLFVCTGNSCRSVMAEYLFREALKGRKDIEALSAGTSAFLSGGPTPEAIMTLRKEGIDASRHQARGLTRMMLKKADLILAMTSMHRYQIVSMEPTANNRTYLLREFAQVGPGARDLGVPDPIGQGAQTYDECAGIIKEAVQKIVELV